MWPYRSTVVAAKLEIFICDKEQPRTYDVARRYIGQVLALGASMADRLLGSTSREGNTVRTPTRILFALLLTGVLLFGCSRDANTRKSQYVNSAKQYFDKGEYQEAAIQYLNAIQVDKKFANAHYGLAQCYLRQHLWQMAYQELSVTVALEPENWQARMDTANLLFDSQQFEKAREQAVAILKGNPTDLKAQLLVALSDGQLGDLPKAIGEASQAVAASPSDGSPYVTLGALEQQAGKLDQAEQTLRKATTLDPKLVAARLALGGLYASQQRWSDAETQFRAAIDSDRTNPSAWASLASLYVASGKQDLAEHALQDAKKAMPNNPNGYRLLAQFYVANGDQRKALNEYASLHQEHPSDFEVSRDYIQVLIQDRQLDDAMKLDVETLKRNPGDADSLVLQGQILNLQQKPSEAIPVLETATKTDPRNALAHLQLGGSYFLTGNIPGAEAEWNQTVKLQPQSSAAWADLAVVALRKGDVQLLEDSASQLIRVSPGTSGGYVMRALARAQRRDFQDAEADFRQALKLDPKSAFAYTGLAGIQFAQKKFGEAENLYNQALAAEPDSDSALQGLITLWLAENQPEKALARLSAEMAKRPDKGLYQFLLGEARLANHQPAAAEAALQKAVDLDKTNLNAFSLLAQVQESIGQTSSAFSTYERSIQDNPKQARAYAEYGLFQERQGNWRKAEELYRSALQVDPRQPSAANNLSYLLLEHGGDLNYALSLAQVARRGMPDSPNTADTLAWTYYKLGLYDSAIGLLREAIKETPQSPTYHYHIGLAYEKSHQIELARASLERALRLDTRSQYGNVIREALAGLEASQ
jgi:tetratricopeptide (TPR) repeat protein